MDLQTNRKLKVKSVRCRKCGAKPERVPRGIFMKALLFWLTVKRYHCSACNIKFYRIG